MFNDFFFEKHAVYEIKFKNVLEEDRRISYSIPKATNTHSEYLIFTAFFTAKMVAQTLLSITLYVYCPPSSNIDSLYSFLHNSVWPLCHWMSHETLVCKFPSVDSRDMRTSEVDVEVAQLPNVISTVMIRDHSEHTSMLPWFVLCEFVKDSQVCSNRSDWIIISSRQQKKDKGCACW